MAKKKVKAKKKSKWGKPKLIVLIRGRKEEISLAACKSTLPPSGPSRAFNACYTRGRTCGRTCYQVASS